MPALAGRTIKIGNFPLPVRLGGRAVGWVEEEIASWARDRVLESRPNLRSVIGEPATSVPFSQ